MSKFERCYKCIHREPCGAKGGLSQDGTICNHFKDKSLFVELPCELNSEVWFIAKKENDKQFSIINGYVGCFDFRGSWKHAIIHWTDYQETYRYVVVFEDFGKTVFLTKEEAEKKLKKMG